MSTAFRYDASEPCGVAYCGRPRGEHGESIYGIDHAWKQDETAYKLHTKNFRVGMGRNSVRLSMDYDRRQASVRLTIYVLNRRILSVSVGSSLYEL